MGAAEFAMVMVSVLVMYIRSVQSKVGDGS